MALKDKSKKKCLPTLNKTETSEMIDPKAKKKSIQGGFKTQWPQSLVIRRHLSDGKHGSQDKFPYKHIFLRGAAIPNSTVPQEIEDNKPKNEETSSADFKARVRRDTRTILSIGEQEEVDHKTMKLLLEAELLRRHLILPERRPSRMSEFKSIQKLHEAELKLIPKVLKEQIPIETATKYEKEDIISVELLDSIPRLQVLKTTKNLDIGKITSEKSQRTDVQETQNEFNNKSSDKLKINKSIEKIKMNKARTKLQHQKTEARDKKKKDGMINNAIKSDLRTDKVKTRTNILKKQQSSSNVKNEAKTLLSILNKDRNYKTRSPDKSQIGPLNSDLMTHGKPKHYTKFSVATKTGKKVMNKNSLYKNNKWKSIVKKKGALQNKQNKCSLKQKDDSVLSKGILKQENTLHSVQNKLNKLSRKVEFSPLPTSKKYLETPDSKTQSLQSNISDTSVTKKSSYLLNTTVKIEMMKHQDMIHSMYSNHEIIETIHNNMKKQVSEKKPITDVQIVSKFGKNKDNAGANHNKAF